VAGPAEVVASRVWRLELLVRAVALPAVEVVVRVGRHVAEREGVQRLLRFLDGLAADAAHDRTDLRTADPSLHHVIVVVKRHSGQFRVLPRIVFTVRLLPRVSRIVLESSVRVVKGPCVAQVALRFVLGLVLVLRRALQ